MDFDVGFMYAVHSQLSLAFVANQAGGVFARGGLPRTYSLGLSGVFDQFFRYHLDALAFESPSDKTVQSYVSLGFERKTGDFLSWRAGGLVPTAVGLPSALTTGFGFDLPKFSLNYGLSSWWRSGERPGLEHRFDITVPFW